jgi:hypothetical protein
LGRDGIRPLHQTCTSFHAGAPVGPVKVALGSLLRLRRYIRKAHATINNELASLRRYSAGYRLRPAAAERLIRRATDELLRTSRDLFECVATALIQRMT